MPVSKRNWIVLVGIVFGVGVIALALVWSLSTTASRDPAELNTSLLDAIRNGDTTEAQVLLQQGADANVFDEAGDPALMRAALYADVAMMKLLLDHGAKIKLYAKDGTNPLLRTIHDLEKMKLLLERGTPIDDLVILATASVPGSRNALELLFQHGATLRTPETAYTPLMAAAGHGDLEAVKCLLDHGANVKTKSPTGFTALIGASLSGNPQVVALLLERGADPNAVCTLERGILQTPIGVAASLGHAECVKLLLTAGADVNVQGGPFNHAPILGAATTASKETVQLLLANTKTILHLTDWTGETAMDWASRCGETEIVKLLRKAGASESKLVSPVEPKLALQQPPDIESIKRAISAALPILQKSERKITETRNCVSCHQHPLVSMTVSLARKHGFAVDEAISREERAHILKDLNGRLRPLMLGTGIDPTLSVHLLVGLAAEDEPASRGTDALVQYLVLRQRKDGRWQQENVRPPDEASDFQFTAMAVRGLQVYAAKGRTQEIARRIDRAQTWLQKTEPADTTDRSFQILGLGWSRADAATIKKSVAKLIAEQRSDGGWSQLPTLKSDAYATGLALYALHEGGGLPVEDPAYRRGVEYLLKTQHADGSWFVQTRSFPFVEYTTSGFPHGRSQFISAAATCYATMALTFATPKAR